LEAYNYAIDHAFNPVRFLFPRFNNLPLKTNKELFKNLAIFDKYIWGMMDQTKKRLQEKKENQTDESNPESITSQSFIDLMYENNLPEETIRDNVSLFFIAGHETTANSLGWILAILGSNQAVQQKARQEISQKIPNEYTFDSLKELNYIDGLIKEGLRIYPPAAIVSGRQAKEDTVIGHVRVPAGTFLDTNFIAMSNNPKVWGDPDQVRPERWFPENITKEQRSSWQPFSGGPRICIGMNFSLLEQKIFIVTLLKRFKEIKMAPGGMVIPKIGGFGTYSPDTDKLILQFQK